MLYDVWSSLPPPEEVLSVVRVADTLVLGTTQGLATVHSGTVVPVETKEVVGLVHLLHHIPSPQLLVLATEQSQLVTLPTRPVISGSTSLEPQPVPDHSVLVGTSKFYEIDLKNFSAEEFLDLTNPGIQKSVATLEFKESAPHCVMDITTDTGEEKE